MKLNMTDWKEFKVNKIFNVEYGNSLELESCELSTDKNNKVNFVARTRENNGVTAWVKRIEEIPPFPSGLITVAGSGSSTLSTFVQEDEFYSGYHLFVLIPKENLSLECKRFFCVCLEQNKYKYGYGRQANKTLPFIEIKLPIQHNEDGTPYIDDSYKYSDDGYVPDWQFMEDYIKSLHHKPLTTKIVKSNAYSLNHNDWEEFTLNDVFVLKGGFYNKKPEHSIDGKISFLASTEANNGVTEFYSIDDIMEWDKAGNPDNTLDKKMYKGNCIAVTVNGSVCNAFYQIEDFTCSHDITAFYVKKHQMNVYLAMFLCTVITKDKYRWSYGRKPHDVKKFGKSIIKLPIQHNPDGTIFIDETHTYSEKGYVPDWEYMENYIKSLPYGDRLDDIKAIIQLFYNHF